MTNLVLIIVLLIRVESRGNDFAVGDFGAAVGCLQIHEETVHEANRILGRPMFCLADRWDRWRSIQMAFVILDRYWTREWFGRQPTVGDAVRIWQRGPTGARRTGGGRE